ncbi:MAG TPA: DMT family transporter [Thiopseudomonas sp.]|nr:DMT family transporter [Thiopseudomonas sp.]
MQYAFPLLAVLFWAANTVVNKMTVGVIFPAEIGFYRWLFAGVLFTPFMLRPVLKNWRKIKPHWWKVFILGVLGMAVYQSLAYFAAPKTSATHMGIILSLMPVMSLGMAIIALGQRVTMGAVLGAVLSLFGVLLVVSSGDVRNLTQQGISSGDAMMLVATLAYALYGTLLKYWQLDIAALQLLYLQVLVGIVVLFPLFWFSEKAGLNSSNVPLVLFACVFASIAAPLAWMHAIRLLGPSRTAVFFNLMPVLTIIIAAIVLSESLELYHAIGGGLTLFGVILSERWTRPLFQKSAQ